MRVLVGNWSMGGGGHRIMVNRVRLKAKTRKRLRGYSPFADPDSDPHYFMTLDPDPHWSENLDPDPYWNENLDPDPHKNENLDPDQH